MQPSKVFYQINEDAQRTIKIEQATHKTIAAYASENGIIKGKED